MVDKVNVSVNLPPALYELLRSYTWQEELSRSDIMVVALEQLFARWQADPKAVKSDLATPRSIPEKVVAKLNIDRDLLEGWRGRRLLACRAAETLRSIVEHLDRDNGADVRSEPAPMVTLEAQNELANLIAVVLRMTLLLNDGRVSPQRLPTF